MHWKSLTIEMRWKIIKYTKTLKLFYCRNTEKIIYYKWPGGFRYFFLI